MSTSTRRYLEIGKDGLQFVTEQESIIGGDRVMTPTDSIEIDDLPVDNIEINGVSRIEAVKNDNGKIVRLEFDEAEYTGEAETDDVEVNGFWDLLGRETHVSFNSRKEAFEFDDSVSDKENFTSFIRFLFDEGYIKKKDLPYQTKYARSSYLINTDPVDEDGSDMPRAAEILDDVYVATYYGIDQKKSYMKMLVNDFVKGESI